MGTSDFVVARRGFLLSAAAQAFFVAAGPLPVLHKTVQRPGTVTAALASAQVLQFLIGLLLIPQAGALGAAAAKSVAVVAWTLGMWIVTR